MESFLLFVYSIGLAVALPTLGPVLLIKEKARAGLAQKLGLLPQSFKSSLSLNKETVWFHAVSVGEFTAVLPFIELFHRRYPHKHIAISTTTKTGNVLARERAGHFASVFYFPFDLPWVVTKVLGVVRPSIVFMVETELWPCFTDECYKRNIPLVILNGRMSPRSFRSYSLWRPIFGPMFKKFSLIGTQSQSESNRYEIVAGDKLPTIILGNLKYDNFMQTSSEESTALRERLGIDKDDLVLIAGSTHETEEELVLRVLDRLESNHRPFRHKLIIAPRHPERFERVIEIVSSFGRRARRCSREEAFAAKDDVFVLDTIGELAKYYAASNVAFVGGTIAKVGGHNLLEPYAYGVPVACGPHLFKTKETARILRERGALLIGKNQVEVEGLLYKLFADEEFRKQVGEAGQNWLKDNQGAVGRALSAVEDLMIKKSLTNPTSSDSNLVKRKGSQKTLLETGSQTSGNS
jgi:3-deoxy-D-manno-octulosonic-acid transferase